MVQRLMNWEANLHSTEERKVDEMERVQKDLQVNVNGYTPQFLKNTCKKISDADRSDKEIPHPNKLVHFATVLILKP